MNRLAGKVAIITGGNSGVGAATAVKFAAEGAKVVITARREAPLLEVADKIRAAGGEVLPVVSDISKAEDAKRVLAATLEAFGKVDILINNAGVLDGGLKAIDSFTDEDMNRVIDINTKGTDRYLTVGDCFYTYAGGKKGLLSVGLGGSAENLPLPGHTVSSCPLWTDGKTLLCMSFGMKGGRYTTAWLHGVGLGDA